MGARHPAVAAGTSTEGFERLWPTDLTFLLHAAADRMVAELDCAATRMGLRDVRDWLVLAALEDGAQRAAQRTQLELSKTTCIDKTTLISVLDRLEQLGLVVRTVDPADRRVRIPQITADGLKAHAKFAVARDAAESNALSGVDDEQRAQLIRLLAQIAHREAALPTS